METGSGMAECSSMCSTAEEHPHLRAILEHFGFRVSTTSLCDSVAARGTAQCSGVGKVTALAFCTLWPREIVKEWELQIESVTSKANKADLETKVLPEARLRALRRACGIVAPRQAKPDSIDELEH